MKRVISIVLMISGIISIATGVSLTIIDENNKAKALENLKTSIVSDYENFKVKIESFSDERSNIYEGLNNISYLTDLNTNYSTLISEYEKYEQTLKEIDQASENLKTNCFEEEFIETDINNKVSAFIINYEQAVNYFIQDVERLNEKIRKYNEWIEQDTTINNTYQELEEYKSSYTEYMDVDGDGKYNGISS